MHVETDSFSISLTLLILASCVEAAAGFSIRLRSNPLNIEFGPAPSAADGPPLSRGAVRDPAYLPAEVGGIVGAYVFFVTSVLVALWTVGRRLRREKTLSRKPVDVEMRAPPYAQFSPSDYYPEHFQAQNQEIDAPKQQYPSPLTPISTSTATKNFSWPSPEKTDRNPYVFPAGNDFTVSPVASDPSVDIRVVQADREQLHRGLEDIYAHVMAQDAAKAAGVQLPPPQVPAPAPVLRASGPAPAPAPELVSKKSEKSRPTALDVEGSKKPQSRASSFIQSLKSPRKKNARELQISSPMPTPLSSTFPATYASDEEPLSPRYYSPPPPPSVPTDQVPYISHSRNTSTDPSPVSPARSIAEQVSSSKFGPPTQHFQHRPDTSITSISQSSIRSRQPPHPIQVSPDPINASSRTRAPLPAIKTQPQSATVSANASTRTLPFRAFDPPPGLASPSFSQMTKTTVLERTTPLSPGLRTPWTAGAMPYSPYQPQTPLIPVTPRLVTKEDRKRTRKEEKRAPVLELIKSDDEMWDSGY